MHSHSVVAGISCDFWRGGPILLNKRGCAEDVDPIEGEDHLRVEVRELSKLEDI